MVIQRSDEMIFRFLALVHVATAQQIARYLARSLRGLRRRLRQLRTTGYVDMDRAGPTAPAVWYLAAPGIRTLVERGLPRSQIRWQPKYATTSIQHKAHEVELTHLLVSLLQAAPACGVQLLDLRRDPGIWDQCDTGDRRFVIRPDGLVVLRHRQQQCWRFIELDRGTKPIRSTRRASQDVLHQLLGYGHYASDGFTGKYDAATEQAGLLFVTNSPDRQFHVLAEVLSEAPAQLRYYALYPEAIAGPFEAIWLAEADFLPVVTAFTNNPAGTSLARLLPPQQYPTVWDHLPASWQQRAYKQIHHVNGDSHLAYDTPLLAGVCQALVTARYIKRRPLTACLSCSSPSNQGAL